MVYRTRIKYTAAHATRLGGAPSTVSREVNRNGGLRDYRASKADEAAWDRAHRPKPCKLVSEPVITGGAAPAGANTAVFFHTPVCCR
jgi:IS30 family transposase